MNNPKIVTVIEPAHLEQDEDENDADGEREQPVAPVHAAEDHQKRDRDGSHVGDAQQPAPDCLAPDQRRRFRMAVPVDLDRPSCSRDQRVDPVDHGEEAGGRNGLAPP